MHFHGCDRSNYFGPNIRESSESKTNADCHQLIKYTIFMFMYTQPHDVYHAQMLEYLPKASAFYCTAPILWSSLGLSDYMK